MATPTRDWEGDLAHAIMDDLDDRMLLDGVNDEVRGEIRAGIRELITEHAPAYRERYHELLFAVASVWPGETRHETALRYIRQREAAAGEPSDAKGGPI